MGRRAWAFSFVVGLVIPAFLASPRVSAGSDDLDEVSAIRQLQGLLRTTSDRDSIRFLLALAYRDTGTLEGRTRALDLLRAVRPRYWDDYRYHRELALTYLEGERYDDARESMRRAVQKAHDVLVARGDLSELLFRHALRTCERDDVKELLRLVNETLALAPANRTALLYKSLALSLGSILDPSLRAANGAAGLACTEMILQHDPEDRTALLLQGGSCLDLGEPEKAEQSFLRGLAQLPPPDRAEYLMPRLCAPEDVLQELASAPRSSLDSLVTAYWDARDPTPLTLVNESRLEYWKRLALADLFFGQPGDSLRGWQTPRGALFVRYGPPESLEFTKASFEEGEAMNAVDTPLLRRKAKMNASATFRFLAPAQTWQYTFGGRTLGFTFIDPTLHDRFVAAAPQVIESFARLAPAVLTEGYHGNVRNCFVTATGTRGEGGRTREALVIGLPAGNGIDDSWAGARLDVKVFDRTGQAVIGEVHTVPERSFRILPEGTALTVIARENPLPPGRYTTEVKVTAGERAGTFARLVEVRSFGRDSLQISDLRLSFAPAASDSSPGQADVAAPDPMGLVSRGTPLEVAFEVYNLTPGAGDRARYRIRYTILPLAYAREYSRLLASGDATHDAALQFGGLGRSLGGVTLEDGNYADVLFPPIETTLASSARCRSAFRLETAGLRDGTYALLVSATDLNVDRMVSVRCPFTVLSKESFRIALASE